MVDWWSLLAGFCKFYMKQGAVVPNSALFYLAAVLVFVVVLILVVILVLVAVLIAVLLILVLILVLVAVLVIHVSSSDDLFITAKP